MAASASSNGTGIDKLARTLPLYTLAVELTSRCNLRCAYCRHADGSFRGSETRQDVLDRALEIARRYKPHAVSFVGDGEITISDGWMDKIAPFLQLPIPVTCIVTNLQKPFDEEEIEFFSRFRQIIISLDTVDRQTLKEVRVGSDVRNVFYTLARIRGAAVKRNRPMPGLKIQAVLTNRSALQALDLAT
ncbi:MAG: radical SAM protein, partial [Planctomycetota bacterium]